MKKWALLATALVLVAVYVYLSQPPQAQKPTTPVQQTTSTPAVNTQTPQTPTRPPASTPTAAAPTPVQQTTSTPAVNTQTPQTPRPPEARREARLEAWIEASDVNTTKLPVDVTYVIYVKNTGDAEGAVRVDNQTYAVAPGQTINITRKLTATSAGRYVVREEVGNATLEKIIVVRYYVPRLVAQAAKINVTKIPQTVAVNITVVNQGNATAYIRGVEIRPGEARQIAVKLNVTAAGAYYIDVGGVPARIEVTYLHARTTAKTEVDEVEALPGEEVAVPITLVNTGNATSTVEVGGAAYAVKPGETVKTAYVFKAQQAGPLEIPLKIDKEPYVLTVEVKILKYIVQISLTSPVQMPGIMTSTYVKRVIELPGTETEIRWQPIVLTNSTKRAITLIVDGTPVRVEPRKPAYLPERTLKTAVPSSVTLAVEVNQTRYVLELDIRRRPPEVKVDAIYRIKFTDTRRLNTKIICTRPIQHEEPVTVYEISATVDFEYGTIAGRSKMTLQGKTDYADFQGQFNTNTNQGTLKIDLSRLGFPRVTVEFQINPLKVVKTTVEGYGEVSCDPQGLIPTVLALPDELRSLGAQPLRIDTLATLLVNAFAKSNVDRVIKAEVNDDGSVTVRDGWGTLVVKVSPSVVEIAGASLSARIYGKFSTS